MFKQHEIRNDVVLGRSKEHNGNLGIEKTKNPYLLYTPPPPPLLSLLIGYIKFLFPKQFDTIFNLD
jgi:hypothetical protein